MAPSKDDPSIGPDAVVLRVLHANWVTTKGGAERPTSDSLKDSNFENSCFVEEEISVDELRNIAIISGKRIARIPVKLLREEGYWLERRPDEAPEGCTNPAAHLICGPPDFPPRGQYEAKARRIVRSADVQVL
jgi:hypothetical protein